MTVQFRLRWFYFMIQFPETHQIYHIIYKSEVYLGMCSDVYPSIRVTQLKEFWWSFAGMILGCLAWFYTKKVLIRAHWLGNSNNHVLYCYWWPGQCKCTWNFNQAVTWATLNPMWASGPETLDSFKHLFTSPTPTLSQNNQESMLIASLPMN